MKGNSGGNRVRPYGFMLLLAFGAALLGVLAIHKLRERRVFHLLVKERDRELISLQLLLQKERESVKEKKSKNEELKAKLFSVQTEKMELDRRLLELRSTIDSLRDEGRILESALQEKQAEIRMLREANADIGREKAEIVALTETLKQKDALIEDLKHGLENPSKTREASTEDLANPDLTIKRDTYIGESKQEANSSIEYTEKHDGANSTKNHMNTEALAGDLGSKSNSSQENGGQKGTADADGRQVSREYNLQMLENSDEHLKDGNSEDMIDVGDSNKTRNEAAQSEVAVGAGEQIYTNTIINTGRGGGKSKYLQTDLSTNNRKEDASSSIGEEKSSLQQELEHDQQGILKGGTKLEMADTSKKLGSKRKGKHLLIRANGRRWKVLTRNRRLGSSASQENDAADRTGSRKTSRDNQSGARNRKEATNDNEQTTEKVEVIVAGSGNHSEVKKQEDSPKTQLVEQEDLGKNEPANGAPMKDDGTNPVDNVTPPDLTNVIGRMEIPQMDAMREASVNETFGSKASSYEDQSEDEDQEGKDPGGDIPNRKISSDKEDVKYEAGTEKKTQEEVLDREQRTDTAAADLRIEKGSISKGAKEEYKEEADEADNFEF